MVSNSRGAISLSSVVSDIGCEVGTVEAAIGYGDVMLIAIPLNQYQTLPADLLAGKIVIDANNYYPDRDGHIAALDAYETTTSQLLADHLKTSRIVKTFNAILAKDLVKDGRPHGAGDRRALPVAADDDDAKGS